MVGESRNEAFRNEWKDGLLQKIAFSLLREIEVMTEKGIFKFGFESGFCK